MAKQIDTTARNSVWRRLSKNISKSKIGAFARCINEALGNLSLCKTAGRRRQKMDSTDYILEDEEVSPRGAIGFVYPEDRYRSNSELLEQLEVLEKRFNKQSEIIAAAKGTHVHLKKAKPYHGYISPDLGMEPNVTIRPSQNNEDRFAIIQKLVKQLQHRGQNIEG
ncbi:uncharacterized protein LOC123552440 [Mercenaria mercenaria]|uniref:uncharacterized protein LOC123552440 n=1 Tax=Mercenaria mercenaria TaxID=6596 RepID=UPI00234F9268|nr:uncharacterized protein LOC123552440 [Mercenaria mercenaria]